MNINNIELKDSIEAEDFRRLKKSVGFQKLTPSQAETVLANTSIVINALYEGKSIGMVRILTDRVTDAYITDVIVDPEFQGTGVGRLLLDKTISVLKETAVENVKLACSLYANSGKEAFYEKFGLEKLPNGRYGYGMIVEL